MSENLVGIVARRFQDFTRPYLAEPGDDFVYQLKIEHTQHVAAFATDIAAASHVPERVAVATRIAALLHDVGRFPQYKQYRTFRDADSANHAALSIRNVLRQKMLDGAPKDIRRLVLAAVYLHNKKALPDTLPAETLATARIVRDSDKLDIYRVMLAHFNMEKDEHPEVMLNVKPHPTAYSKAILDSLMRREVGDYRSIVWMNDIKLMGAAWLYDLNFRRSCEILQERGYINYFFATLPDDPEVLAARRQVESDLANRLSTR
jgi:hypothetical protein